MQGNQFLALVKRKVGIIVLLGILVAALSFLFLVVSQKNFKVSTDFLVVQNQTSGQDYYSLSKSAEYIGSILSESIHSEAFINEVVKTGKVDNEFLPFDKRRGGWPKCPPLPFFASVFALFARAAALFSLAPAL